MLEELYERYYPELFRWCTQMTQSPQTAEELVQEGFLRAMLHLEQLNLLDEKQRRAWLYRTIKNLYVDQIRHRHLESIVEEIPETVTETEAITNMEWNELINALPDMEGALFTMRYLDGYNSTQIGKIFDLSPGAVRAKLSSARKHLKEAIGGYKNG